MKFHLDMTQFGEFRKKLISRVAPIMMLPLAVIFLVDDGVGAAGLTVLPIAIVLLVFAFLRTVNKQKKGWETFELKIDDETVSRYQEGLPPIVLNKTAIKEAIEAQDGAVTLVTQPVTHSIIIPSSVQNKEELLAMIGNFTTIRKLEQTNWQWKFYTPVVAVIALFAVFMKSNGVYTVLVTGLVLFAFLVWSFIETQRSKHYDKQIKRSSYAVIILLLVIIIKISWVLNGSIF